MRRVREYLLTLVGVVILSGVILMLGADGSAKNYIKLVCSLSVLSALISPLSTLAAEGGFSPADWLESIKEEEIDYDEIYRESLDRYEKETVEKIIKDNVLRNISIKDSDLKIEAQIESKNNKNEITSVTVILRDRGLLCDPREIADLINETVGCPCVILYE